MRPYRHRTIDQLRHGTGRTDRSVRLIGPRIGRFDGLLAQDLRIHALRIAALENRRGLRRQAGQHRKQVVLLWQARGLLPLRGGGKRIHRLDRLEFLFRDHRKEIAVTHHLDDAGQLLGMLGQVA